MEKNLSKKTKIGLSLLIALAFCLPTASAVVSVGEVGAGDRPRVPQPPTMEVIPLPMEATPQQPPGTISIVSVYLGDYKLGPQKISIPTGTYPVYVELFNDYTVNESVKVFIEIYRKCCGDYKEVVLYETSFEDNFDIYNNWMQIDIDHGWDPEGNVGFFDTFTWTDKRAFTGDHSFKCTMYDTYKGNQDDYFMCTKSFDVSDQYAVNVSFNIWVEGQGDIYTQGHPFWNPYWIFDYLDFEVGDDSGDWFNPQDNMLFVGPDHSQLPGGYYFFDTTLPIYTAQAQFWNWTNYWPKARDLGGGWWHVWYEVKVDDLADMGLNVEDIMFRFSWHSDPQFQYEGAYVDDFKVVSIEDCEQKVFQTHTQGPVVVVPHTVEETTIVELPMKFQAIHLDECKETCYEVIAWIQITEPALFWTPHDWVPPSWWFGDPQDYPGPRKYRVCTADYYDVRVLTMDMETSFGQEPIGDGDIVMQGDDIHITSIVHIAGTIPGENIAVKAYAQKKTWETIFYSDCENFMDWPVSFGFVHISDRDSWSGARSIGFFDEIENEYPVDAFSYIFGPTVDFSQYEEVVLDFYTKYATETGFDYFAPCLVDWNALLVLTCWDSVWTGYSSDWIGPKQPGGLYHTTDLKFWYDAWTAAGFLRDGNNRLVKEVTIGFYFLSDPLWYGDSQDNHHHIQKVGWSGAFIDAVEIRGQKLSDPVWEQTVIIPGPCNPCETCEIQFEWEDVPYSNYKITVEVIDEKACGNWDELKLSKQILVVSEKEKAHPKDVESQDLSGVDVGRWGKCTSDYDNYLSTNPDSWYYPPSAAYCAYLAPGGNPCIDISELTYTDFDLKFDAWWDLDVITGDQVIVQIANCVYETGPCCGDDGWCAPDEITDWYTLPLIEINGVFISSFTHSSELMFGDYDPPEYTDGWVPVTIDLDDFFALGDRFCLRFVMLSDADIEMRGMLIDSVALVVDDTEIIFGPDEIDTEENWLFHFLRYGQFWKYDETVPCWYAEWPPGIPFDDRLIWHTEIMDCYEAYLTIVHNYSFPQAWTYDPWQDAFTYLGRSVGRIEISSDGENWFELAEYVPPDPFAVTSAPTQAYHFDITPWAGQRVQIRFRANTEGVVLLGGYWYIYEMYITGKQDHVPPVSQATMSGTMKESGWYTTPVKITITATDDASGVKEIHYILDGVETVVAGDYVEFTVSENGPHTVEYWAVDVVGNEEQHKFIPEFRIDTGSPPTVAITAPEPGLYILGKKILDISSIIIIGAFTIEATASDAESGVYRVQFYLNGDIIGEDTEAPYAVYCAVKHMGDATIKVVAEDFAQNVAEDTLDIKYYKFL